MKNKEKQLLLDIAQLVANQSSGIRLKVGGVVTDSHGNIIATGYNGTVRGFHTNELENTFYPKDDGERVVDMIYPFYNHELDKPYRLETNQEIVVHAEQNLIAHAARRGISIDGGMVFLTVSPCQHCTAMLIQSGIKEAIYLNEYRLHNEVKMMYNQHIKLTHWKDDEIL